MLLTTNYQKVAEVRIGNTGYSDVYLRAYAKYDSQSIANNQSSVSYKSTLYFSTGEFYVGTSTVKALAAEGAASQVIDISGTTFYAGETTLNEITGTVTHNVSGSANASISATFKSTSWGWDATAQTADLQLPNIPRYTTITQSLNSKTETTIKMNWSAGNTVDYVWYSKDNGATWVSVGSVNATSGTYTISGLSPNTSYNIKTRVRRKDSQLTTDTSSLTVNTYDYPHITVVETSNLIIGNSQKLTIYNPLSRNVTIRMNKDSVSGTQLYSSTTTETSITFTPNASTLYNSIPNSKNANCVYSCIYEVSTRTTQTRTYAINESQCYPTFSNFTYEDISEMVNLTGNNQLLVDNYSSCKFTISSANKAVAKNGASIKKYVVSWGSSMVEVSYSTNDVSATITPSTSATGNTLKVTVYDSRDLYTTVTKTINNIAYINAVINELTTQRANGVDVQTFLRGKFTLWKGNWRNGTDSNYANQLTYVGYRVYNGTTWTDYFDITNKVKNVMSTYDNSNSTTISFDFNDKIELHANGSNGGFEIGKEYKIQVMIKDGTSTIVFTPNRYQATLQADVSDGKVGLARYKDNNGDYHYAVNGMPDDELNFNVIGKFGVNGKEIINESKYVIVKLNANKELVFTGAQWQNLIVPFDTFFKNKGDFTLQNGNVIIPKDVNTIEVMCLISTAAVKNSRDASFLIYKNDTAIFNMPLTLSTYNQYICMIPAIEVVEGDKIKFTIQNNWALENTFTVRGITGNSLASFMSIKKID